MLNRSILVAGLFLVVALSGCASVQDNSDDDAPVLGPHGRIIVPPELREALTKPVYEIGTHEEHHFTGTTGIQLYIDWVLPATDGPFPTILIFTPYQGTDPQDTPGEGDSGGPGNPYRQSVVDYFVPRGYVVAFADVRGNHEAGGCIDQTGPEQWQDGYDYVEWIAAQDWSNEKVGMWGASYDGETQFTTAMMAPPHLTTIVPVASVSNQYEWSFYDGVPYEMQPFFGMFSYFLGSATPSSDPDNALLYPEKLMCQPQQFAAGTDFSGDNTTFWQERDYRAMAGNINASVLHVHGLRDWNVRPNHVDPLFNNIQSEKRAIFGQWGHAYPDREDWQMLLNAWYDYWLLDMENGILDILPPVLIEDDTEQWWGIDSFPPQDNQVLSVELSSDGTLVSPGNATSGDLEIQDYPEEVLTDLRFGPVPDEQVIVGQAGMAPDRIEFTFTTQEELRLVGRPSVVFEVTTHAESVHWAVKLEVDGHACEAQRSSMCQNTGYRDSRHRNGVNNPEPLENGETYTMDIRMFPQYDVIPAGSTVRLIIQNNDPEIQQDQGNAHSILHLGEGKAMLYLPLAPAAQIALPHDELPDTYPGYVV